MNERIRELAEKAGFYVADDKIYIPTISEDITICQTKFAELIVRECCRALHPMLRDMISRGHGVDLIKEHFGVK